ncbi:hypothetical protein N658DRAFT_476979 [Parathielavia hyrcaniae]|uniref:Heterokaryon incompatibility domain-containing protein n=1 Tax=Parathielavia hyrcaniae TaxID=113614 RepID=A0AAN6SYG5_9PEZI|nr:hypothetical protein N658DRAFT_476979 [Parathielavia hyrcaniae]
MTRTRARSQPNARRTRPPYTYTPLPSPRHVRLIRLIHFDPILSQVFITLTAHPIDTLTHRFTALSYTWGSATEPFEPPQLLPHHPTGTNPQNIELIVVPQASFQTFRRTDDLATTEGALLDLHTPPGIAFLDVTGNLSDFFRSYLVGFPLRHLQSSSGAPLNFQQVSHLWIDAICIDQGSPAEKAAQIPLMGEVYSRAGRVLAWLGAEERRLGVFCWWHRVVYPRIREFVIQGGEGAKRVLREGDFVDGGFWREFLGLEGPPGGGRRGGGGGENFHRMWADTWVDYWAFYRTRRYFHRAWIVQEVVVAGRFDMMAGVKGEMLSWEDMTGFAFFLGHVGWLDSLDALVGELLSGEYTEAKSRGFGITDIGGMQAQHQIRHQAQEKTEWPEHWWAALSSVRRRGCFLPQDKVFATVGILQQALPEGTPLPFPVDPTATPEEVFTHAATTLLINSPHLTLLSFVDYPFYRNLASLPSWVPDLTTAKFPWPLGHFGTPFTACISPSPPPYPPPPRTITPKGELCLRGFRLDTISHKSQYQPPLNTRLAETALQFLATLPVHYPHAKFPSAESAESDDDSQDATTTTTKGQFREAALVHTLTCHETSNINRGTPAETARLSASFRDWLLVALGQVYAACLLRPGDNKDEYSAEWVAECEARKEAIGKVIAGLGEERVLVPGVEELEGHGRAVAAAKRGEGPWPEGVGSQRKFSDQVKRVMLYRCLFRTAGGWIGVCSDACEVGDEVWLLEGGAVPYVLRRDKESKDGARFVFCGECYVHGVMDGELLRDGLFEGKFDEVVIL